MPKEKIITGIDIGSTKISTTIATVDEKKVSVIGVSGDVPSKGINRGIVVDIDSAVESISASLERAERMAGVSVSSAFVTLNGSHIETQNSHGVVAVTPGKSSEITSVDVQRVTEAAQAISLASNRELVHVIPRDFEVDSQAGIKDPVGMAGNRLEVETNIIHGSSTTMRNIIKCVNQLNVEVADLVYVGIANAEAVLTDTEKELGTLLVDIGGGTTSIIAYLDGSPIYSAVFPLGGKLITSDLAIGLRARLPEAEKIKLKLSMEYIHSAKTNETNRHDEEFDISEFGLETVSVPKKLLYKIIDARVEEIFRLIALDINKAKLERRLPAGLVITGGGALTAGVDKVAKDILKTPVRIGYPRGVTGLIDEIQGPSSSACVGALLYGTHTHQSSLLSFEDKKGKMSVNFKNFFERVKSFLP